MSEEIIIADLLLGVDVEQPADALIDRTVQNFQNALRGRKIELPVTIADPQQIPTLRAMREQAVAATQAEARADRESLAERRRARNEYANWWKAQLREQEQAERRAAQEGARAAREQAAAERQAQQEAAAAERQAQQEAVAAERAARQEQARLLREHQATVTLNARLSAQAERESQQALRGAMRERQEQIERVRLDYTRLRAALDANTISEADFNRQGDQLIQRLRQMGETAGMTTRQLTQLASIEGRISREQNTVAGVLNPAGLSNGVAVGIQAALPGILQGLSQITAMSPGLGAAADQLGVLAQGFNAARTGAVGAGAAATTATGATVALGGAAGVTALAVGAVGVAAVGTVAGIGASINSYADFEKSMNAVKAVAGDLASGEFKALQDQALELGASTKFSATEIARAQEELLKAGVKVKDVLAGATSGVALLASATGTDLTTATDIAAKTMNMFGVSGEKMGQVADVITNAANKTALDVTTLGAALQQVGGIANDSGLSLQETAAILGVLADKGMEGSDAGTSLKTMLQRLKAPTDETTAALDNYNIKVFDSAGKQRDMVTVIGEVLGAMDGMTDRQRAAFASTIAGDDAVRALTTTYRTGIGPLKDYIEKMDEQGSAAEQSKIRMEGLRGAQEKFSGALETFKTKVGSFFTPAMTEIVDAAANGIERLSQLFDWLQKLQDERSKTEATALEKQASEKEHELDVIESRIKERRRYRDQQRAMGRDLEPMVAANLAKDEAAAATLRRELNQLRADLKRERQQADMDARTRAANNPNALGPALPGTGTPANLKELPANLGVGRYVISQEFGSNPNRLGYGPRGHQGVDVATPVGTAITAAFEGTLYTGFEENGYGRYVKIIDAKGQALILGHLSRLDAALQKEIELYGNAKVKAGRLIAYSGNSGRSTGPHLHMEGRTTGNMAVDPRTLAYAGAGGRAERLGGVETSDKPGGGPSAEELKKAGLTLAEWNKLQARAMELAREAAKAEDDLTGKRGLQVDAAVKKWAGENKARQEAFTLAQKLYQRQQQQADADARDDENAAKQRAALARDIEKAAAQGRIEAAKRGLNELKRLQDAELEAAGENAEKRAAIVKRTGPAIIEAEKTIARRTREAAVREAAQWAAEQNKIPGVNTATVEKERRRRVQAAYAAEREAVDGARADQARAEAGADKQARREAEQQQKQRAAALATIEKGVQQGRVEQYRNALNELKRLQGEQLADEGKTAADRERIVKATGPKILSATYALNAELRRQKDAETDIWAKSEEAKALTTKEREAEIARRKAESRAEEKRLNLAAQQEQTRATKEAGTRRQEEEKQLARELASLKVDTARATAQRLKTLEDAEVSTFKGSAEAKLALVQKYSQAQYDRELKIAGAVRQLAYNDAKGKPNEGALRAKADADFEATKAQLQAQRQGLMQQARRDANEQAQAMLRLAQENESALRGQRLESLQQQLSDAQDTRTREVQAAGDNVHELLRIETERGAQILALQRRTAEAQRNQESARLRQEAADKKTANAKVFSGNQLTAENAKVDQWLSGKLGTLRQNYFSSVAKFESDAVAALEKLGTNVATAENEAFYAMAEARDKHIDEVEKTAETLFGSGGDYEQQAQNRATAISTVAAAIREITGLRPDQASLDDLEDLSTIYDRLIALGVNLETLDLTNLDKLTQSLSGMRTRDRDFLPAEEVKSFTQLLERAGANAQDIQAILSPDIRPKNRDLFAEGTLALQGKDKDRLFAVAQQLAGQDLTQVPALKALYERIQAFFNDANERALENSFQQTLNDLNGQLSDLEAGRDQMDPQAYVDQRAQLLAQIEDLQWEHDRTRMLNEGKAGEEIETARLEHVRRLGNITRDQTRETDALRLEAERKAQEALTNLEMQGLEHRKAMRLIGERDYIVQRAALLRRQANEVRDSAIQAAGGNTAKIQEAWNTWRSSTGQIDNEEQAGTALYDLQSARAVQDALAGIEMDGLERRKAQGLVGERAYIDERQQLQLAAAARTLQRVKDDHGDVAAAEAAFQQEVLRIMGEGYQAREALRARMEDEGRTRARSAQTRELERQKRLGLLSEGDYLEGQRQGRIQEASDGFLSRTRNMAVGSEEYLNEQRNLQEQLDQIAFESETARQDMLNRIQDEGAAIRRQKASDDLDYHKQMGLVSEREFIDQRLELQQQAASEEFLQRTRSMKVGSQEYINEQLKLEATQTQNTRAAELARQQLTWRIQDETLAVTRKAASDDLEFKHQMGLISEADYLTARQQQAEAAARDEFTSRTRGMKEGSEEYKAAEAKLQADLTAIAQQGTRDRTELAKSDPRIRADVMNAPEKLAGLVGLKPHEFDAQYAAEIDGLTKLKGLHPEYAAAIQKTIDKSKVLKGLNMAHHYLGIAQSVGQAAQTIAGAFGQDEIAQGIGKIADGLGQAGQATMGWAKVASGDMTAIPAAIMNTVGALDSFLQGIQDLDPAYQKWKKNQLEIASLQRDAMGQKKYNNWLVNPYYDALKQDSANREKLANAKPLQRFAWWLFGNAPQVLDDEAAKAQAKAASIFNDFASDMAGTFEQEMLSAWEEGDFSNVADKMGKQLDRFVARLAIQTVMAKSNLSKLVQDLSEEVARGGDTSDEIAAIRSEYDNIIGTSQAVLSALPGYGSGAEGGAGQGGNLFGNAPTAQLGIPRIEVSLPETALRPLTALADTAARLEAKLEKGLTLDAASLQVTMPDSFLQGSALWASTMPLWAQSVPIFAAGASDLASIPAEFRAVLAEWRASMRNSDTDGPPPHSGQGSLT
ncbi:phage tail tape measure protein (plasmid) [Deinococcus sp. VB142]|uniref:Phage tail tape measure protein n=1 Tax=Deinococcus sp. VB142 TaxID=3112952 RepID=A0AAU6Q917_9DEIO